MPCAGPAAYLVSIVLIALLLTDPPMRYLLLLLSGLFLLLAPSCADDDELTPLDQLPPATQTGENIVACLIDGEPWVNDPNRTGEVNISASYYDLRDWIRIRTFNSKFDDPYTSYIGLTIQPPATGLIELDSSSIKFFYRTITTQEKQYFLHSKNGVIDVSLLDIEARIISGIFSGSLISEDLTDTLEITDGRFDVTFF